MKYIKLFEQFEDEEESWWNKESKFDNLEPKLLIGKYYDVLYLLIDNDDDTVTIYGKDNSSSYKKSMFNYDVVLNDSSRIVVPRLFREGSGLTDGKMFYKDLPKEIKDRL